MGWDQLIYKGIDVFPNVRRIAYEIHDAMARAGYEDDLERILGATTWSDHDQLNCLDIVCDYDAQVWVRQYLQKNRDRLGLILMINQHKMFRTYAKTQDGIYYPANSWAPYEGTSNPHTDHVHAQFYKRVYKPASTSNPITPGKAYPKPSGKDVYVSKLNPGVTKSDSVYWAQSALNRIPLKDGAELELSGNYDKATVAEVKKFQSQIAKNKADGDLGPKQAELLFKTADLKVNLIK